MAGNSLQRRWITLGLIAGLIQLCTVATYAQPPVPSAEIRRADSSNLNLPAKTLGGKQFWTDIRVQGDWRIQQNSETGHFRLLNSADVRQTWGSKLACERALNKRIAAGEVTPYRGKIVILLHGLLRSSDSMSPMAQAIAQQGYQTIEFRYASSRKSIQSHATALRNVIQMLGKDVTEIDFVGHSLGNIVVRAYVGAKDAQTGLALPVDSRIKRMVMIGPPNHGSKMATVLQDSLTFRLVAGTCGQQLSRHWNEIEKEIGVPDFEFGIIAGGQSDALPISNAFVPGKDDFTVSVEEAKLDGASDFVVAPLFHSTMMFDADAIAWTLNFLEHGYLKTAQSRTRLPRPPAGR